MKVTLLDASADDLAVVNAARVSFAEKSDWIYNDPEYPEPFGEGIAAFIPAGSRELNAKDKGLIHFLLRNRHGTPFEHGYFRFHVEAPIFVFREWHRHRVGHSYNEMSGRYTELEKRFFKPNEWRVQVGKPGAYKYVPLDDATLAQQAYDWVDATYEKCWETYRALLDNGIAKEQARIVLPVGIYSQMYWSCNPRSLMHFLGLRSAPDAQAEIRELAEQAEKALNATMPETYAAFVANGRRAP